MSATTATDCLPLLRALADPTRWEITRLLTFEKQALSLGEVANRLGLSDYNASRHVKILREAGIVSIRKEGRFKLITITPDCRDALDKGNLQHGLNFGCCSFDFDCPPSS